MGGRDTKGGSPKRTFERTPLKIEKKGGGRAQDSSNASQRGRVADIPQRMTEEPWAGNHARAYAGLERGKGEWQRKRGTRTREGNRTPVVGLKGHRSTIKLLRRNILIPDQLPLTRPCYDLAPIANRGIVLNNQSIKPERRPTDGLRDKGFLRAPEIPKTSTEASFRRLTGSLYLNRRRIHRSVMMNDY